jgi:hypothetical protein
MRLSTQRNSFYHYNLLRWSIEGLRQSAPHREKDQGIRRFSYSSQHIKNKNNIMG